MDVENGRWQSTTKEVNEAVFGVRKLQPVFRYGNVLG